MAVSPPPPVWTSPWRRIVADLGAERRAGRAGVPFPPGPTSPSLVRTERFARAPLPLLLALYERYGPVFSLRVFHGVVVFALGPEANHHITVANAANFRWREGHLGDLIPLLGDGMLTIDGDFHRHARRVMLPAFHHRRIAAAADTVLAEVDRALPDIVPGRRLDLYRWTRELALRVAMRALFGLDPDDRPRGLDPAAEFERALSFWGTDYALQVLRGPFTPWARMQASRARLDALIHAEVDRRRRTGARGEDILSLLLDARDEDGGALDDDHVRDQVMTLLFAGHDTTTSTVAFLVYELARHPETLARLYEEQDRVLGARPPQAADLMGEGLPELELAIDETLRLYPPAWIGPRRAVETFGLCGVRVAGGLPVNSCSWASHHLPDVWEEPDAFRPERFAPERRAALPKGAYVPFGGGSRTCIGMRFGQLEVRAMATRLLQRARLEVTPGYRLRIRMMPTLSPRDGLPVLVLPRGVTV